MLTTATHDRLDSRGPARECMFPLLLRTGPQLWLSEGQVLGGDTRFYLRVSSQAVLPMKVTAGNSMLLLGHILILLGGVYLLVGQVRSPPLPPLHVAPSQPRSKPGTLLGGAIEWANNNTFTRGETSSGSHPNLPLGS